MSSTITLDPQNKTVAAVVTQIRSDIRAQGRYAAYVTEFEVTKDTVKDHALALAGLVTTPGPQTKDGVRTKFGKAVAAAGNGLRHVMTKDDDGDKDPVLRVSLSGEGGGSTTVPADHPLYSEIVALLG